MLHLGDIGDLDAGVTCKSYHAGLKGDQRSRVLAEWTAGEVPVVAATIAFGMGIDKPGMSTFSKGPWRAFMKQSSQL